MATDKDIVDRIFVGASNVGPAAEPVVKQIWVSLPFVTKASFALAGPEVCSAANLGWGEALNLALDNTKWPQLLQRILPLPFDSKIKLLTFGEKFAAAGKKSHPNYRSLADFWPDEIADQEVVDFLKRRGFTTLAEIAETAARKKAAPKPPPAAPAPQRKPPAGRIP